MRWHALLLLTALLVTLPAVFAPDQVLTVTLEEDGKITNYLNTYWVVQVNGTGAIANPSDRDLFDVRLYFDILNLDLIDEGGDGSFDDRSLFFDRIPAAGSAEFAYTIVGITTEPPTLTDKGVLYTGLSKRTTRIYSDVFGELQKAPLEDPSITNRDARLISTTLSNPTEFQFTIESLNIIKTSDLNPNNVLDTWQVINASSPRILDPDGFFVYDTIDYDAQEGQVYWLDTEVYISRVQLIDNNTIARYTEQNLTVPIEELNFTNESSNVSRELFEQGFALRKRISDTVAVPGQPLTVMLVLQNFGDRLEAFSVSDNLPAGFSASRELEWSGDLPARNSVILQYDVVLEDSISAGFDLFPSAEARVGGKTIYSDEVPFVRQFVPDDRVYVQKRVQFRDDDKAVVQIRIENFGKNSLQGARLKEFLDENDLFSEMTAIPESKGVWLIPDVAPGEEWTVEYVTEQGAALTRLPTLYGANKHSVLRSIVLENVVSEAWGFVRTNLLELAGLGLLIFGPFVFFAGRKLAWF